MKPLATVALVLFLVPPTLLACRSGAATPVPEARAAGPAVASAAPSPVASPQPHPSAPAAQKPAQVSPAASSSSDPVAEKPPSTSTKAPPACPEGMLLVDGEYCSKVEHQCLSSWYDESNKKKVCERFEPTARCVGTKTKKRFCIDRYEWPNRAGERPEVMNRFHQAEVKCAAVNKRLCTESEWTMACEGPSLWPFPYGFSRDINKCHGDVEWDGPNMQKVAARDPEELARLWKGVRSGSQPECKSGYGVFDLPGNADEIVSSETFSNDFRGKFDSVHTGGPWYKGVRNQCRPKIYTHDEGFYYYYLSFRCCSEPDGTATDPRTTKQRRWGWGFERVERTAGFTRADVVQALTKKAEKGHCGCAAKDVRCNTICGTLLGASAKDYPKPSPLPERVDHKGPASAEPKTR